MAYDDFSPEELAQDQSFRAWATGTANSREKQYWDQWVEASEENRLVALHAQYIITGLSFKPTKVTPPGRAWKRLNQKVRQRKKGRVHSIPRKHTFGWVYAAAASLLLLITVAIAYWASPFNNEMPVPETKIVATEYGQQKQINLSDGTTIVLNAHSTLRYTANQAMQNGVEVFLEGEAYFNVASRTDSGLPPFTVMTEDGSITVRGTKFAVATRQNHTRVVLEEGKVAFQPSKVRNEDPFILQPNEKAIFRAEQSRVDIQPVNAAIYTSWTTDELVFDHTRFAEVKKRLEYTFGKKVIVQDRELLQRPISGSISNANAEVIVTALANILNTEVVIGPERILFGDSAFLVD